ncbi:nucleoside deaminase [Sutcliffiella halmapala]|uniref:nucleoside deaminase n=1 Tax=Sutcliffiella halmapala TaxID=79882 RepID=UPI0009952369|nr:nucleoside deaminase [Sutcliffiella halmapala]
MDHEQFLKYAIKLANENVKNGEGGPFGAIIVKDGVIIGQGVNKVTSHTDPTAHAEVQAIRHACLEMKDFQLTNCTLYTSCEPCPMCFGAIYWARLKEVYYAYTKDDAKSVGFDDEYIYKEINTLDQKKTIPFNKIDVTIKEQPFTLWETNANKKMY